jgi:hypothetical protein
VLSHAEAHRADLALPEHVVLALSGIPWLVQRVKTLRIMAELDDALKDMKKAGDHKAYEHQAAPTVFPLAGNNAGKLRLGPLRESWRGARRSR